MHHVDGTPVANVLTACARGVGDYEGGVPPEIKGTDRVEAVAHRPDGETFHIECDFVFNGTGERPNSEPAQEWLGVEVGPAGEVVVDRRMRISVPDVRRRDLIGPPMEMLSPQDRGDRGPQRDGRVLLSSTSPSTRTFCTPPMR
jgi:dihydrolipoamide dehydrogenase